MIEFDAPVEIPEGGWGGDSYLNVALAASSPEAQPATSCSSARTRRRRPSSRTWPGSASSAAAAARADPAPQRDSSCLVSGVPVAKAATVVFSPRSTALPRESSFWSARRSSPMRPRSAMRRGSRPASSSPTAPTSSSPAARRRRWRAGRETSRSSPASTAFRRRGPDVGQVRRREDQGDPARTALRQPRRRQRGAVRRASRGGDACRSTVADAPRRRPLPARALPARPSGPLSSPASSPPLPSN